MTHFNSPDQAANHDKFLALQRKLAAEDLYIGTDAWRADVTAWQVDSLEKAGLTRQATAAYVHAAHIRSLAAAPIHEGVVIDFNTIIAEHDTMPLPRIPDDRP